MYMLYQIMRPRLETHFSTRGEDANPMFLSGQRPNYQLNVPTQVAIAKTILQAPKTHIVFPTGLQPKAIIESDRRPQTHNLHLSTCAEGATNMHFTGINGAKPKKKRYARLDDDA